MLKLKVEVAKGLNKITQALNGTVGTGILFKYTSVSLATPGHYHLYISFLSLIYKSLCFSSLIFIILLTFLYQEIYF